jgi:hypothetical protein
MQYSLRAPMIVVVLLSTAFLEPGRSVASKNPEHIAGRGCLEQGAEAGCFMVQDAKSKKLYSLHFASDEIPEVGMAILFVGMKIESDNCMQGIPLNIRNWTKTNMRCAVGRKPRS